MPHAAYALNKGPKPAATPQPNTAEGKLADAPITITDGAFPAEVLQSKVPVLIDFWAPWCGPCHMLAPTVEKIAKKYAGKIKVGKLNVDQNPRTAGQYQTMSIPTLILFYQGKVAGRLVGVQPQANIEQMIDSTLRGR
ncbi:MAG: thioredoxin [Anaerolineae bacterium]|nr:thioredoxin [Anaerolineae bacterium]